MTYILKMNLLLTRKNLSDGGVPNNGHLFCWRPERTSSSDFFFFNHQLKKKKKMNCCCTSLMCCRCVLSIRRAPRLLASCLHWALINQWDSVSATPVSVQCAGRSRCTQLIPFLPILLLFLFSLVRSAPLFLCNHLSESHNVDGATRTTSKQYQSSELCSAAGGLWVVNRLIFQDTRHRLTLVDMQILVMWCNSAILALIYWLYWSCIDQWQSKSNSIDSWVPELLTAAVRLTSRVGKKADNGTSDRRTIATI